MKIIKTRLCQNTSRLLLKIKFSWVRKYKIESPGLHCCSKIQWRPVSGTATAAWFPLDPTRSPAARQVKPSQDNIYSGIEVSVLF